MQANKPKRRRKVFIVRLRCAERYSELRQRGQLLPLRQEIEIAASPEWLCLEAQSAGACECRFCSQRFGAQLSASCFVRKAKALPGLFYLQMA